MQLRTTVLTARTHDVIVLGGGTAGCLPLTFQRYLRADRAGQAAQEWARLGIVRSMALPQPSPG